MFFRNWTNWLELILKTFSLICITTIFSLILIVCTAGIAAFLYIIVLTLFL